MRISMPPIQSQNRVGEFLYLYVILTFDEDYGQTLDLPIILRYEEEPILYIKQWKLYPQLVHPEQIYENRGTQSIQSSMDEYEQYLAQFRNIKNKQTFLETFPRNQTFRSILEKIIIP